MPTRVLPAASALLITLSAMLGTQFSGATFTRQHQAPAEVHAKDDWAPPVVTTDPLPVGVSGSAVAVSAHAADDRSSISSITLEYLAPGAGTWVPISTGCTFTPQSDPKAATSGCSWDTTAAGVTDGDYQVRARATDAAGYEGTSDPVATTVANNGSLILSPIASYVRGIVQVTGTVYGIPVTGSNQTLDYRPSGSSGAWTLLSGAGDCQAKSNPVICSWDTSTLADGSYDMRFRASKLSGQEDSQTGIVVDNTGPSGTAVSVPASPLYGTVAVQAAAGDATAGIGSVAMQFQQSGASTWSSCGTATTAPYSCSLDTTFLTNGATYNFRAVAEDRAGNRSTSPVVSRTVDNSPASVSITNPVAGSVVNGAVPISVHANAPSGVTQVRVEVRPHGSTSAWSTICTTTSSPYGCTWSTTGGVAGGDYDLRAVMSRNSGADVTSAPQTVTVDNNAGTIALDPPPSSTATSSGPLVVTGTFNTSRTVTKVEVKATPTNPSGAVLTIACDPPGVGTFSCSWPISSIVYGEYDLRAEMTQATGTVVSSATPVHVTVDHVSASISLALSPAPASARVAGTEALTAGVTSNYPVTSVSFQYRAVGASLWDGLCPNDTTSPYECSWNTLTKTPVNGDYEIRSVLTLQNGQTRTASTTVTVANLWGVSIDATPSATSNAQQPTQGDSFTFGYSTMVEPTSLVAGWTGAAPAVVSVLLNRDSGGGMTMSTTANLGSVKFTNDFLKGNKANASATIPASLSIATDAAGRSVVTVQLTQNDGNEVVTLSTGQGDTMVWTPSSSALGYAVANPCATTVVNEATPLDWDF